MRYIYIILFTLLTTLIYSQGAGIQYMDSVPTHTPDPNLRHSTMVKDLTTGRFYQWNDSIWRDMDIIRTVDSVEQILNESYTIGERITIPTTGATYLVQSDSVAGYQTDSIAVVPVDTNYAVLQPINGQYQAEWFGAVGDSITNDVEAIQNATNYTNGQTILFDSKDYLVNGTVVVKSNSRLLGKNGSILWREDSAPTIWFDAISTNNVSFRNIEFKSDKTSNFQTIIDLDNASNALVEYCNLELLNTPLYGETMHGILARGADNSSVRFNKTKNCQIKMSGAGLGNSHNWITDNYIETPFNFGISSVTNSAISDDTIRNLYIERNIINSPTSQGGIFVGADGPTSDPPQLLENIYINDNIINGIWADPIDITTSLGINFRLGTYTRNIDISNNVIENDRDTPGNTIGINFAGGDSTRVSLENVTISENKIGTMGLEGIRLYVADSISRGIRVIGNRFTDNRALEFETYSGTVEGVLIHGNYVDSIGTDGFNINLAGKVKGFTISDNTFRTQLMAGQDAIKIVTATTDSIQGMRIDRNFISDGWSLGLNFENTGGAVAEVLAFGNIVNATTPYTGVVPNTTLLESNIELTENRDLDLGGNLFRFYDNTFGSLPRVQLYSDRTGSGASPLLEFANQTTSFDFFLNGATDDLEIGSGTSETIIMETGTGDAQLYFPSTGGFSSGAGTGPSSRYHFNHTSSFDMLLSSSSASGIVGLGLSTGDQDWIFGVEGNNNDRLVIEDVTGGSRPIIITKGAPDFSMLMNTAGEIQVGTSTDRGTYNLQVEGDSYYNGGLTLAGATSGTTELVATAVAGTTTATLQAVTGTIALLGDLAVTATESAEGIVELATVAELDAGTDVSRVPNVNNLAGSDFGTKDLQIEMFAANVAVSTGDGNVTVTIPASLDGYDLVNAVASVHDKGITGTTDVTVERWRAGAAVDMLSTAITVGDEWFAQDGTINTANDDVITGDRIYINVDVIHTTPPNGLSIALEFRKP